MISPVHSRSVSNWNSLGLTKVGFVSLGVHGVWESKSDDHEGRRPPDFFRAASSTTGAGNGKYDIPKVWARSHGEIP